MVVSLAPQKPTGRLGTAMISEDVKREILGRIVLSDVIGEYVRLRKQGPRHVGLCPFHGEKSPSFSVNDGEGFYYCFGCRASGDAYRFLMEHEGLSFPESVRKLADRVGVEIPEDRSGATPQQRSADRVEQQRYLAATDVAQSLFRAALQGPEGAVARSYLERRGVDEETATAFGLGYAPDAWGALVDHARQAKVSPSDLELAGLVIPSDKGAYDRFRHRVMFPIHDLSKRLLAFSGRALRADERAKYINSPETRWYTKGHQLYGLIQARTAIREADEAVLVEGNFDVVSLHARGLRNVVAALGTALTREQARLLFRFTQRAVLAYDGDKAGRKAARAALDTLLEAGFQHVRVVVFDEGDDPDTFVTREGAVALRTQIETARPMLDVCLDAIVARAQGADAATRAEAATKVAELLRAVQDPLVRQAYQVEAARRLNIEVKHIQLRSAAAARGPSEPEAVVINRPLLRLQGEERALVRLLLDAPALLERVHLEHLADLLDTPALADFLRHASARWVRGAVESLQEMLMEWEDDTLAAAVRAVGVSDPTIPPAHQPAMTERVIVGLRNRWLDAEVRRVSEELRRADPAREAELLAYLDELRRWRPAVEVRHA